MGYLADLECELIAADRNNSAGLSESERPALSFRSHYASS